MDIYLHPRGYRYAEAYHRVFLQYIVTHQKEIEEQIADKGLARIYLHQVEFPNVERQGCQGCLHNWFGESELAQSYLRDKLGGVAAERAVTQHAIAHLSKEPLCASYHLSHFRGWSTEHRLQEGLCLHPKSSTPAF